MARKALPPNSRAHLCGNRRILMSGRAAAIRRNSNTHAGPAPRAARLTAASGFALLFGACAPIHTDYFETRAFEVTVDLTAEGERMQITRTIECEPWRRRRGGLDPYTQWRAKTKSFGQRLPSGAAVMMVTPSFCRSAYRKKGATSDDLPVSPGHIPYIGWADDADNPTVIETYISPDYFKRPDARVRYHGLTARIVSAGPLPGKKTKEFDWFGKWTFVEPDEIGFALYAQIVPKEIWQEIPIVAANVQGAHDPKIISQKNYVELAKRLSALHGKRFSLLYGRDGIRNGYGLTTGPSPDRSSQPGKKRPVEDIVPLLRQNMKFEIDSTARGYLAYYRIDSSTGKISGPRHIMLKLGAKILRLPVRINGLYGVYDPRSEAIYKIYSGDPLNFPTPGKLGTVYCFAKLAARSPDK